MNFARLLQTGLLLVSLALPLCAQEPEIILCAKAGDLGCIKKAVKKDKSALFAADKDGNTVLILAAARGANAIISYVAYQWPDWRTNDKGSNPLHAAAAANHADTAKLIISFTKDDPDINFERFLNAKDTQNGATPLHLAAARCNGQLYDYLLEQGAKADLTDFAGRTPAQVLTLCKNSQAKKTKQAAGKKTPEKPSQTSSALPIPAAKPAAVSAADSANFPSSN